MTQTILLIAVVIIVLVQQCFITEQNPQLHGNADIPLPAEYYDKVVQPVKRSTCIYADLDTGLTEEEKKEVVDAHNYFRKGENAAAMFDVVWDEELGKLAKVNTNKCKNMHSDMTLCDGRLVGQNVAMGSFVGFRGFDVTKAWYNEKQWYNIEDDTCEEGRDCGHYTEVVWSDVRKIGCAYTLCTANGSLSTLVTCNYFPNGNVIGQTPYTVGEHCSQCDQLLPRADMIHCEEGSFCTECKRMTDYPNCVCMNKPCELGGMRDSDTCLCPCLNGKERNTVTQDCECGTDYCDSLCSTLNEDVNSPGDCGYWKSVGYCDPDYIIAIYRYMKINCIKTCELCDVL